MAPKKKEKNLKRSNIITLKLTDIELAVLNEAADITGLSRSEYVRKLLLEKQINHQIEIVADMEVLRKLVDQIINNWLHFTKRLLVKFHRAYKSNDRLLDLHLLHQNIYKFCLQVPALY